MTDDWAAKLREEATRLRRKADAVTTALAQIKVKVSSRRSELNVTVNASGKIDNIQLTPQAMRLGETGLAQLLTETIRQAQTAASEQAAEAARPLTSDPRVSEATALARDLIGQPRKPDERPLTDTEMDHYYQPKSWLDRR